MDIRQLDAEECINIKKVTEAAFAASGDADIDVWFSFDEMRRNIELDRSCCLAAVKGEEICGAIYAQAESPINGPEGMEKWVINLMAVNPEISGQGIGTMLIAALESLLKEKGIKKLFVFANETDKAVQAFYEKNGFVYAGRIQDYQYGKDNSAVFLLKYLKVE